MDQKHACRVDIKLQAGPEAVWKALTDPALVRRYFYGTRVESDWKVGSPIRWRGEWQGKAYEDKGEVLTADRPRRLAMTYWSSMGGTPDLPENYMTVAYELTPARDGTYLAVVQGNAPTAEVAAHSEEGWKSVLAGLKEVVEEESLVPYQGGPDTMDTDLGS